MTEPVRICFVCLGNICRSPTAEGVMRHLVAEAGLAEVVEIDSAGTGAWHVGDPPDRRARAEAGRRGLDLTSRGRQLHVGDLAYFHLVLAMDRSNLADLHELASGLPAPGDGAGGGRAELRLLREFDPDADPVTDPHDLEVPDPYYGGPSGFADVFDLVEAACRGLLDHLRSTHLAGVEDG